MRQSIYWPTVFAFLENPSVRDAVMDACDRNGVDSLVETEIAAFESNGNSGSVCGALNLIQPENIDDHDRHHLGQCLSIIAFLTTGEKFVEASKKEPAKKEPSKKAPKSTKEKAVKVKSPAPEPSEEISQVDQKDLSTDVASDLTSDAPVA